MRRRFAVMLSIALLGLAGGGGGDISDADSPPPNNHKPSSNQNPDANIGAP